MRRLELFLLIAPAIFAQDLRVTGSQLVLSAGGRVSWGTQNNLLAFDRVSPSGFYDVYTSNPDGSSITCLTCDAAQLPAYNKGNPEWHPSNQFLAIQVQESSALDQNTASPGVGVKNDLYISDAAGKNYWQVTYDAPGVLHPRFSHDGNHLLWVQRSSAPLSNDWTLMLANFTVVNNIPQVTNIQSLPPCQQNVFCETGGFSFDDSAVFFTGALDGQSIDGIDIYSYNLTSGLLSNLTNSPGNWDEFPTSVPNTGKIVWTSGIYGANGLQTEYWMMDDDGSNKLQLTYFNDQRSSSWYLGSTSAAKFSWGPAGTQLAAYLIPNGSSLGQIGNIYTINLEPAAPTVSSASFARPPLAPDSIASTFYMNLATSTTSATTAVLPVDLAGTSALVTDALNITRSVPLFFVSPGQANWEVPANTAPGPATVQFIDAAGVSSRATIDVETADPGIFTSDATGSGPPAGYLLTFPAGSATSSSTQYLFDCGTAPPCTTAPVSLGSATDSAYLVLFGTGLRHAANISVTLGSQTLPVAFSGPQGTDTGLDQVNVLVPNSFSGSGLTTLFIQADGFYSNTVQLLFH